MATLYTSLKRIGVLTKEVPSGKLIDEWTTAISASDSKPATSDLAPALAALLAVKDDEELVSLSILVVVMCLNGVVTRNARGLLRA